MLSHISFATIPVTDLDRARDFWCDAMGMTVQVDAPMGASRWVTLEIPGARTRLHLDPVETVPATGMPALPVIAEDVAAMVARLKARGVAVLREPGPAEWDQGTIYAMIRDSEGNAILIASR